MGLLCAACSFGLMSFLIFWAPSFFTQTGVPASQTPWIQPWLDLKIYNYIVKPQVKYKHTDDVHVHV